MVMFVQQGWCMDIFYRSSVWHVLTFFLGEGDVNGAEVNKQKN